MHNGIFPIFTKGRVLKKESIEYLRDFPYDLASLACVDYSDGIISGFSVCSKDEYIHLSKGALKYHGDIVIVPDNEVKIIGYEQPLYIKLVIGKCQLTEDYKIRHIEIKIDKIDSLAENEIELGRFCLNRGAVLRCEYDSFSDLRTPENTLDITHVRFAGIGAATLHPRVLKEYARAMIANPFDTVDFTFAMMCLNAGILNKSSIEWYIAQKTGSSYKEYTIEELYEKLMSLLPQHSRRNNQNRPRGRGPSIS